MLIFSVWFCFNRPKCERELLRSKVQKGNNFSLEDPQQSGTKTKESPKLRELQGHDHLSLPEQPALMRPGTQDVVERQSDLRTKTSGSCSLSRSQATHTEVVVEVLVHEDPASVEPDTVGSLWRWHFCLECYNEFQNKTKHHLESHHTVLYVSSTLFHPLNNHITIQSTSTCMFSWTVGGNWRHANSTQNCEVAALSTKLPCHMNDITKTFCVKCVKL